MPEKKSRAKFRKPSSARSRTHTRLLPNRATRSRTLESLGRIVQRVLPTQRNPNPARTSALTVNALPKRAGWLFVFSHALSALALATRSWRPLMLRVPCVRVRSARSPANVQNVRRPARIRISRRRTLASHGMCTSIITAMTTGKVAAPR